MNGTKNMIKKNERSFLDIFIAILVLFSLLFIILTVLTSIQPLTINEKVVKNEIKEKVSFEYYSIVQPSSLYPAGGKIVPKGIILAKLTNDFVIKIKTSITAKNPVSINYKKNVIYKISAENLWEKEFSAIKNISYTSKATTDFGKDDEIHLNLKEIYAFIAKVEEETAIRNNYILEIRQTISGNISDEKNEIIRNINNEYVIPFEISGQYLRYNGEMNENETITNSSIEETKVIPGFFNFVGLSIPLMTGRLWFGMAAAISVVFLIICMVLKSGNDKRDVPDKTIDGLERKNKGKIIIITDTIDLKSATKISIEKLKDLFKIADEKEESIYKYSDDSTLVYYTVTPPAVYYYEDNKK